MDKILRIGGATVNQTPIDWRGNIGNIIDVVKDARKNNIDVLCLPELALTGYGCEDLFLSSWLPEKALTLLPGIIELSEGMVLVVGLPVKLNKKLYNCACVISDKRILGIYAKKFLANDGVHYEPRWFSARETDNTFEIPINGQKVPFGNFQFIFHDINIGFEICEDAWSGINRPASWLTEHGVQLILNPSASHFSMGKSKQRYDLVKSSSLEFKCAYVYANLLGNEAGRMIYDGEILLAQDGRIINSNKLLSYKNYNLVYSDINFTNPQLTVVAPDPNKYLRNEEFIGASSLGLFDYLRKSGNRGFVISLSGGADSSCCAILIAEMIRRGISELGIVEFLNKIGRKDLIAVSRGSENEAALKIINKNLLLCAYQASDNSSAETFKSAKLLAEDLGCEFFHWKISDETGSYINKIESQLGRKLEWKTDDIALQNIQARARSPIIWLLANIYRCILITTSNRSEGDLGYATMDGDTSGSLAPIAAVDKDFIRKWLIWAEKELKYRSLSGVNKLVPTAELRPPGDSQTDEDDLMPYHILVEIEKLGIRDKKNPAEIFILLNEKNIIPADDLKIYIKKFFRLWSKNQWKRERMAPSLHLDDFNIDPRTWCRFPILSGSFTDELNDLDKL